MWKKIMKIFLVGFIWFVVLVFGDREDGDLDTACPIREEGRSLYHMLQNIAESCVTDIYSSLNEELEEVGNSTQIQKAYKNFCNRLPTLKQCLARVKPHAKLCLNPVLQTRFNLYCEYKEMCVEVGCSKDGARLAVIYEASESFKINSPKRRSPVDACRNIADSSVWVGIERDPNLGMVLEYFMLQNSKECLGKHRRGDEDTVVNAGLSLWTEMLDNIKCIDQGTEVLCKTIINSGVIL